MHDFEVDLSEIYGDSITIEQKEEDEYEQILKRLTNYCDKYWICIPYIINDKIYIEIKDLDNCSNELFLNWTNYIWSTTKKLNCSSKDYENIKEKEATWIILINNHISLAKIYKQNK